MLRNRIREKTLERRLRAKSSEYSEEQKCSRVKIGLSAQKTLKGKKPGRHAKSKNPQKWSQG